MMIQQNVYFAIFPSLMIIIEYNSNHGRTLWNPKTVCGYALSCIQFLSSDLEIWQNIHSVGSSFILLSNLHSLHIHIYSNLFQMVRQ
jgi:hypothetical protein